MYNADIAAHPHQRRRRRHPTVTPTQSSTNPRRAKTISAQPHLNGSSSETPKSETCQARYNAARARPPTQQPRQQYPQVVVHPQPTQHSAPHTPASREKWTATQLRGKGHAASTHRPPSTQTTHRRPARDNSSASTPSETNTIQPPATQESSPSAQAAQPHDSQELPGSSPARRNQLCVQASTQNPGQATETSSTKTPSSSLRERPETEHNSEMRQPDNRTADEERGSNVAEHGVIACTPNPSPPPSNSHDNVRRRGTDAPASEQPRPGKRTRLNPAIQPDAHECIATTKPRRTPETSKAVTSQAHRKAMGYGSRGPIPQLNQSLANALKREARQPPPSANQTREPLPTPHKPQPDRAYKAPTERESLGHGSRGPLPKPHKPKPGTINDTQTERQSLGHGSRGPPNPNKPKPGPISDAQKERESLGYGSRGPLPNPHKPKPGPISDAQIERESLGYGSRGPLPKQNPSTRPPVLSQAERKARKYGSGGPIPKDKTRPEQETKRQSLGYKSRGPIPTDSRKKKQPICTQTEREALKCKSRGPPRCTTDKTQPKPETMRESLGYGARGPLPNPHKPEPGPMYETQTMRESLGYGARGPLPNPHKPEKTAPTCSAAQRKAMGHGTRGPARTTEKTQPKPETMRESLGYGARGPLPNPHKPEKTAPTCSAAQRKAMGHGTRGPARTTEKTQPKPETMRESLGYGARGPLPNPHKPEKTAPRIPRGPARTTEKTQPKPETMRESIRSQRTHTRSKPANKTPTAHESRTTQGKTVRK